MILIFLSGKGGVGKSTLAKMIYQELRSRGFSIKCKDSDPQQHLNSFVRGEPIPTGEPDYFIVDTQGAWTVDNISLVELVKDEKHLIIVPFKASDDDLTAAAVMVNRLRDLGVLNSSVFVANETYRDFDVDAMKYMQMLKSLGANVSKWQFQDLKAFTRVSNTGKAKNQIQRFLHEQNVGGLMCQS